eukprot:XP_001708787.1 Hypothetical protein GL50803_103844 [Giardia lamblia ATCC 50803]
MVVEVLVEKLTEHHVGDIVCIDSRIVIVVIVMGHSRITVAADGGGYELFRVRAKGKGAVLWEEGLKIAKRSPFGYRVKDAECTKCPLQRLGDVLAVLVVYINPGNIVVTVCRVDYCS